MWLPVEVGRTEDHALFNEVDTLGVRELLCRARTPAALREVLDGLHVRHGIAEVQEDRLLVEREAIGRELRHDHEAGAGICDDRERARRVALAHGPCDHEL